MLRLRSALLLGCVCALGWALPELLERIGGPERIRADYGLAAAAVLVPVQALVAVSPAPGELVALSHGAIYGFGLGTCFSWLGWLLAAWIEYGLFRGAASELGAGHARARLPGWIRRFPASSPVFLIVARWLPFGNHVANAVAGTCRVPFWRFTWPSALALLPASALFTAIAVGLVRP